MRGEQAQHVALTLVDQIEQVRHTGQLGMLGDADLDRDLDAAGLERLLLLGFQDRHVERAVAVDLAALGREPHLGEAAIALHHAEFQPEHAHDEPPFDRRAGRAAGGAERDLALPEVVERRDVLGEMIGGDLAIGHFFRPVPGTE